MDFSIDAFTRSQLKTYLSSKKILLVDTNNNSRAGMVRMLLGLGTLPHHLFITDDFEEAKNLIHRVRPEIIITDYTIKKGNGLELAQVFNEVKTDTSLFIIITANSAQSTVAQAAEEDVDVYILKPHTCSYFISTLSKAVKMKLNPSDYSKKINNGKKLLDEECWDEAIHWFDQLIRISPTPSLAYFYRSRAELQKFLYDIAEQSLKSGLQHNGAHYKCLSGLFDLLLERGKFKEAYEIVKKLIHFPVNSSRLSKVIELAVRTAHYSDMGKYYEVANEIEIKDPTLMKHISAALVVSGKMLFQKGEMFKAASFLKKASMSATGMAGIQLEVITTLAMNGFIPNAKEVLNRFPAALRNEPQYKIAKSMIAYFEGGNSTSHIELLRQTIEEGANEPVYFYWLIAFLHDAKNIGMAEEYLFRALAQWPDKAEYFQRSTNAIAKNTKSQN